MKILFLTQYCPPEVGAPQNRIFEFAKKLKEFGHEVSILTAMPNYPKGEIFEGYKGRWLYKQKIDGIKIVRTAIYPTKEKKFLKRLWNYTSFTLSSVIIGAFNIERQDVIITESPPLFLGWSGYLLSKLKGAKFVFNVSDLWPESAITLGILNNRMLINLSFWLEKFCYKKAKLITGQTPGIVSDIIDRGFGENKTYLISNGVDTDLFSKEYYSEDFRKRNGLKGKFAVCYAGNHGLAQGLEVILNAADELRNEDDIRFVFVGDGAEKDNLIKIKEEKKLDNVIFLPLQPKKNMPKIMASIDAAIVPLKKLNLFKGAFPSKIYETMCSEVPIILAVEGDVADMIYKADAGIVVKPENPKEMAQAVLRLYNDEALVKRLGHNGRKYVIENYSRQNITRKLEQLLLEIM